MHRLDAKQQETVKLALQILYASWRASNWGLDIAIYGTTSEHFTADTTCDDFAVACMEVLPLLDSPVTTQNSVNERTRDLQIIYDVLNLTPPTD